MNRTTGGWGMGMGSARQRWLIVLGLLFAALAAAACSQPGLVQINKSGNGTGTVKSVPAAIDCGPRCSAGSEKHVTITLGATPDPGMVFDGWDGDCFGDATCTVDLNTRKSVTAVFNIYYTPTPTETPWWTGLGTVTVTTTPGADQTPGAETPTPAATPGAAGTAPAATPTVIPTVTPLP